MYRIWGKTNENQGRRKKICFKVMEVILLCWTPVVRKSVINELWFVRLVRIWWTNRHQENYKIIVSARCYSVGHGLLMLKDVLREMSVATIGEGILGLQFVVKMFGKSYLKSKTGLFQRLETQGGLIWWVGIF